MPSERRFLTRRDLGHSIDYGHRVLLDDGSDGQDRNSHD